MILLKKVQGSEGEIDVRKRCNKDIRVSVSDKLNKKWKYYHKKIKEMKKKRKERKLGRKRKDKEWKMKT